MHYATDAVAPSWRPPLGWSLVALVWSYALLTNFDFQPIAVEKLDLVFNDIARNVIHLNFTVDRDYIQWEVFVRDGKTYAYFNIFPALIRIPLVFAGVWDLHVSRMTCIFALWLGALFNLRLMQLATLRWAGLPGARLVLVCAYGMVIGTGPAIYTLASASLYHEALWWAAAFTAGFNVFALRSFLLGRPLSSWDFVGMATTAGGALLCRSSVALALYAGLGVLGCIHAVALFRNRAVFSRQALLFAAAIVIASAFLAVQLAVSYARWGDMFASMPLQYYNLLSGPENAVFRDTLTRAGVVNIARIPYAFVYYFGAINLYEYGPGWLTGILGGIEGPRILPLLSAPLPILAGLGGIFTALSRPRLYGRALVVLGINGLSMLLMMSFLYVAMRYLMDGWPLFTVGAAILLRHRASHPGGVRRPQRFILVGLLLLSLAGSHLTLLRYKLVYTGTDPAVRFALSTSIQPLLCPGKPVRTGVRLTEKDPLVTPGCPPLW